MICRILLPVACTLVWSLIPQHAEPADAAPAKRVIRVESSSENLLQADRWGPWQNGFERRAAEIFCDNGSDAQVQRGASQSVVLNQERAEPIAASVSSRSEEVSGSSDSNYSLYLDLVYMDGTHLWGQNAPFDVGNHDWQTRQVIVFPDKPVRQVTMHLLLRGHSGKAWFREPALRELRTPQGAARFDGVPVMVQPGVGEGFQVRDVAADSDFVQIQQRALGLTLECQSSTSDDATFLDVTLSDTTGKDRAVTLLYAIPVPREGLRWLEDPRRSAEVQAGREYTHVSRFLKVGVNGGLSLYPFGAVSSGQQAVALGIDMLFPAFYRVGYSAATGELFLAYDLGLTPEKPTAHLRLSRFSFDPLQGFRGALSRYYELFPDAFRCRTPEQGMWMPFAKISGLEDFEDFGFKFKEGNDETAWDDAHGIITFRYTEPLTWWMRMPQDVPRTLEAATQFAQQLADEKGDRQAKSLLTSGYRDPEGRFVALMLDTPWCNGAVWSMNSMPNLSGTPTDFQLKWNAQLKAQLYGPDRKVNLDGEYIDSSEGYVTDELDFCREHFAAARTPLVFSHGSCRPAIFRGLIAQEYVRGIADDIHSMQHLMMANATPIRLCWLAPLLDVMGTETDWNPGSRWQPMSDADLLFRRALCKGKPYCFLMNSQFENFSHELVEKYMRRALAYGMFPGFFSHNAAEGHYFTRPELYNRDRPLFKQYVPLCRLVAEAGWEPITQATSSDPAVHIERFGKQYFTVFNDSDQPHEVAVTFADSTITACRELVHGRDLNCPDGSVTITLDPEDVALLQLK